jgi:hypothetical protein
MNLGLNLGLGGQRGGASFSLGDLSDVTLTAPENGQELVFDGTEWVNQ